MTLQIIPAIDLLDGSCVRLLRGDFNKCKVYELDAVKLAVDTAQEGFRRKLQEWTWAAASATSDTGQQKTQKRLRQ